MTTPSFRWLNPSTDALLTRLLSWGTLNRRWAGDGDTLSIIEQLGETRDPLVIPQLMSFASAPNAEVRVSARSVIYRLFQGVPLEALPLLDHALRTSWAHLEDWYGMKPYDLGRITGDTDADQLYLALTSCHRNGFVRAEALRLLGAGSSEIIIPFALLRLVDWVREVAAVAEVELRKKLVAEYVETLVNCLQLVDRLAANSRFRAEYAQWIENLLVLPSSAGALRHGMVSSARVTRRHCYRAAAKNPAMAGEDLIHRALLDADVLVRKWAFAFAQETCAPGENELLLRRAAEDCYGPIRRIAFDAVVRNPSPTLSDFEPFLLDKSAVIRSECQSQVANRIGMQAAAFYRSTIQEPAINPKKAAVAILGLAETGCESDVAAISGMLANPSARVRRAVIRALRALGIAGQTESLMRAISSDVPSVAREAASTLMMARSSTVEAIWSAAVSNADQRVHVAVLKLFNRAGKWQQLRVYLEAAGSGNAVLAECSIGLLKMWLFKFNRTFAQPTADDLETAIRLVESIRGRLPEHQWRELAFVLETSPN
jgi:HEAT repeat protein